MENVVLEGKIVKKLDIQEGVSTRGPWKKQDFVIETSEQYPKKVCISCWNEKTDELAQFQMNDELKVSVNIESREYNNRWYTDIKAWRIERNSTAAVQESSAPTPNNVDDVIGMSFSDEDEELPF